MTGKAHAAPVVRPARTGRPLDRAVRQALEPRFSYDFGEVRVHTDPAAARSAVALGAAAYTVGRDIVFAPGRYQPQSPAGRRLLVHELAHVVQQHGRLAGALSSLPVSRPGDVAEREAERAADSGGVAGLAGTGPAIHRRVDPEDLSGEMVGRAFTLTDALVTGGVTRKAGTVVTVTAWTNLSDNATVTAAGVALPFDVPKWRLKPFRTAVKGVDPYSSGLPGQRATVEKHEGDLAAWMAKEGQYKTVKQKAAFEEERANREKLRTDRLRVLNRRLIQDTMFNRFDRVIKDEVDKANTAHSLTGKDALDPNLVKSMLFQEAEFGTSAEKTISVGAADPRRSQFNLTQVIQSSGNALLALMETDYPGVVATYSLGKLRKDLSDAQNERNKLLEQKTRTGTETARLAVLDGLAQQNWEQFIYSYRAQGASVGFSEAYRHLFDHLITNGYDFWIHVAVVWLFSKHRRGMSWPRAIELYNGGGDRAADYRAAVVGRAAEARKAVAAGREFIPAR